jgi:hypothetical protein
MLSRADEITFGLLLKPILFGLFLAGVFCLVTSFRTTPEHFLKRLTVNIKTFVGYSVPIIVIGYISGYLTGVSRASAIGALVPAVLTLVGGLSLYLIQETSNKIVIGYSLFMFGVSLFYGTQVGAYEREYNQADRYIFLSQQELEIRQWRKNNGLVPELPNWITGLAKE